VPIRAATLGFPENPSTDVYDPSNPRHVVAGPLLLGVPKALAELTRIVEKSNEQLASYARRAAGEKFRKASQAASGQLSAEGAREYDEAVEKLRRAYEAERQGLKAELDDWARRYAGVMDLFKRLSTDTIIFPDPTAHALGLSRAHDLYHLAKQIQDLRNRAGSLGLYSPGRLALTERGERLVDQARLWAEGRRLTDPERLRKFLKPVIEKRKEAVKGLEKEVKFLVKAVEDLTANRRNEGGKEKYRRYLPPAEKELLRKGQALLAAHADLRRLEEAYETGRLPEGPLKPGAERFLKGQPPALLARAALAGAEADVKFRKMADEPAEVTVKSGQYRGVAVRDVPVDYLIWVMNGGEVITRLREYRARSGTKVKLPAEHLIYEAYHAGGDGLRNQVRRYLRTAEGRRRLDNWYQDSDQTEYVKVLLGAVPELEALSARIAQGKREAYVRPGSAEDRRRKDELRRQVEASNEVASGRRQYQKVRREAYNEALARFKEEGRGPATARKLARREAESAYQKALRGANLDDYSVLYRRYQKAGMRPEEAREAAERAARDMGSTPAAFQGQLRDHASDAEEERRLEKEYAGIEKAQMREAVEAAKRIDEMKAEGNWVFEQGPVGPTERQEGEPELLFRERMTKREIRPGAFPGLEDVPAWLRARHDPTWHSHDPKWYALQKPGAMNMARAIGEEILRASSPKALLGLRDKIRRLFYHFDPYSGELFQPVHPFILWLENRLEERFNMLAMGSVQPLDARNQDDELFFEQFERDPFEAPGEQSYDGHQDEFPAGARGRAEERGEYGEQTVLPYPEVEGTSPPGAETAANPGRLEGADEPDMTGPPGDVVPDGLPSYSYGGEAAQERADEGDLRRRRPPFEARPE
jgi:hypothetical protein